MDGRSLAPGEQLLQCPYNTSHWILTKKQIIHLDKCRKQYEKEERAKGRKPEIVPCRFNFLHRIPKMELRFHESSCPDQYTVVHSMVHSQDVKPSGFVESNRATGSRGAAGAPCIDGEDWDVEVDEEPEPRCGGYDPTVKLKGGNFLYMKPGMTKSERKHAREEGRKKWQEAQAAQEAEAVTARNKTATVPAAEYDDEDDWAWHPPKLD